jgi:hypothetical protein
MTFIDNLLDSIALQIGELMNKSDAAFCKAQRFREKINDRDEYFATQAKYCYGKANAYRNAADLLKDEVDRATKFIEPVENLYQYIQQYGVHEWIEAGVNVLDTVHEVSLVARLQHYADNNTLHFCGYYGCMTGKCGQITLKNGRVVFYNVYKEDEVTYPDYSEGDYEMF